MNLTNRRNKTGSVSICSRKVIGPIGQITGWHHSYVIVHFNGQRYRFLCQGSFYDRKDYQSEMAIISQDGIRLLESHEISKDEFQSMVECSSFGKHLKTEQIPEIIPGNCGIRYLRDGVCHNIANRIMYVLKDHPVCLVPGCSWSYMWYGIWGRRFDRQRNRDIYNILRKGNYIRKPLPLPSFMR